MIKKIKELKLVENDEGRKIAQIPVTTIDYCQVCMKNFVHGELVYYAWIDSNIVCKDCTDPHSEIQLRLFLKGC